MTKKRVGGEGEEGEGRCKLCKGFFFGWKRPKVAILQRKKKKVEPTICRL